MKSKQEEKALDIMAMLAEVYEDEEEYYQDHPEEDWEEEVKFWGYRCRWPGRI